MKPVFLGEKWTPNFDLARKLGSLGPDVKVLKPQQLAERVKAFHRIAIEQYQT